MTSNWSECSRSSGLPARQRARNRLTYRCSMIGLLSSRPPFGVIEPAAEFGRATDPLAPRCALPTACQRMIAP